MANVDEVLVSALVRIEIVMRSGPHRHIGILNDCFAFGHVCQVVLR